MLLPNSTRKQEKEAKRHEKYIDRKVVAFAQRVERIELSDVLPTGNNRG